MSQNCSNDRTNILIRPVDLIKESHLTTSQSAAINKEQLETNIIENRNYQIYNWLGKFLCIFLWEFDKEMFAIADLWYLFKFGRNAVLKQYSYIGNF